MGTMVNGADYGDCVTRGPSSRYEIRAPPFSGAFDAWSSASTVRATVSECVVPRIT